MGEAHSPLCVCSYEDRAEAMDSLILMAESLCAVDSHVSLHLTLAQTCSSDGNLSS